MSLEKQRQISNTIYKIQTSDGILVKSNENIMSHIKMFYTDLYSTRHTEYVDYSFNDSLDTPRLTHYDPGGGALKAPHPPSDYLSSRI